MNRLKVKELIQALERENQEAIVAIESNSCMQSVTQLNNEGWLGGEFFMRKVPGTQKEYFCLDEIPINETKQYIKVIVINALSNEN